MMATSENEPKKVKRVPRGKAVEKTALMQQLEDDPASAMMALSDETEAEWEQKAPADAKGLLGATEEQS
jgi:hypothetical protein